MEPDDALLFYPGCKMSFLHALENGPNARNGLSSVGNDARKTVASCDVARDQQDMPQPNNHADRGKEYTAQQEILLQEFGQRRGECHCEHAAGRYGEQSHWTVVKSTHRNRRGSGSNSSSSTRP